MKMFISSRGHATLHLAVSVRPSLRNIYELRVVFALLPLPNRPRLSCRVSGLVNKIVSDADDVEISIAELFRLAFLGDKMPNKSRNRIDSNFLALLVSPSIQDTFFV